MKKIALVFLVSSALGSAAEDFASTCLNAPSNGRILVSADGSAEFANGRLSLKVPSSRHSALFVTLLAHAFPEDSCLATNDLDGKSEVTTLGIGGGLRPLSKELSDFERAKIAERKKRTQQGVDALKDCKGTVAVVSSLTVGSEGTVRFAAGEFRGSLPFSEKGSYGLVTVLATSYGEALPVCLVGAADRRDGYEVLSSVELPSLANVKKAAVVVPVAPKVMPVPAPQPKPVAPIVPKPEVLPPPRVEPKPAPRKQD